MKRLKSGAIIKIPLWKNQGFAYAKYIDVGKIDSNTSYPEILKVYDTSQYLEVKNSVKFGTNNWLISPIAVAGLRNAIKMKRWEIMSFAGLDVADKKLPDFKLGNETDDDRKLGKWYLVKHGILNNKNEVSKKEVKYLHTHSGKGTGNIEILLTMYFMQKRGLDIKKSFDLSDEKYDWLYKSFLDTVLLP